MNRLKKVK